MAIMKAKQKPGFAAGIYSDMTLDGPEIGTLVVVVDRAKNLPNRRAIGKQDPYCAMRLAKDAKKTNTDRRGGQTPKWDQELRFTVHDSPDYYKLKVSIFNDDKKTELISEAWIDLTNVVKLGGGQSDSWHQLNFKGKYAGDIRVELTYYDTREQPQEKKKKEKAVSAGIESGSDVSLSSRSLGPRDIKRRPLPASPGGAAPIQTPPAQKQVPTPDQLPQPVHAPVPVRPQTRSASPLPDQEVQHDDYAQIEQHEFATYGNPPQTQQSQRPLSHRAERQQPWQQPLGSEFRQSQYDSHQGYQNQQLEQSPSTYPDEQEIWQHQQRQQRPHSVHFHSDPVTPQHSSPTNRPSPASNNSDTQIVRHRHQQANTGPYDNPYVESPLRQSISQQNEQTFQAHADIPPPLPPKHRESPPKRHRNEFPPSAFIPQPLRIGQKRSSVSERSPLQAIEDGYDLERHAQPQYESNTPQRQSMYMDSPQYQPQTPDQQVELYGRRPAHDTPSNLSETNIHRQRPAQSRRTSYEIKHPSLVQQEQFVSEPQPMEPHDMYRPPHESSYQPSVEDAPPSPGLHPAVARKAVGEKAKKLNHVPFGPDAYDVLNPASSPVTNDGTAFQTPAQAKEAARFREVEKLRDMGPIIGNDGREIDPSDHLPADTWAPEPEWKNRPPEHVIHIRSKKDRPTGARAAPLVIHSRGGSASVAQTSPAPSPQAASSPASRTAPSNFAGGRNRLQKAMPTQVRALPQQPYSSPAAAAASSPALAGSPHNYNEENSPATRPLQNRRPSYDNRIPSYVSRPALSEYQVPAGNTYTPRQNSYDPYNSPTKAIEYKPYDMTPTKQHSGNYTSPYVEPERRSSYDNRNNASYEGRNSYDNRSDYSYENHVDPQQYQPEQTQYQQPQRTHYDDPLAAEMSLIDIGPSRNSYHQGSMGRTMARRW